ncbi:hypothetical protein DM611_00995 [Stenotrophomonas maltophilia]|nr:hypothetical protein DM611_00995 [Stenotrophomonas maltophilia]
MSTLVEYRMLIVESEFLNGHLAALREEFHSFAAAMESALSACRDKVVDWKYSVGEALELVPCEHLVPSVLETKGRVLREPTRKELNSKRLVKHGLDGGGLPIIEIRRLDADVERYGELVRFISGDMIVSCHLFDNEKHRNRLMSLTRVIRQSDAVHYVSANPPHQWAVRSDQLLGSRISRSSIMATSWYKQMDYDFVYGTTGRLDAILIGDHTHWSAE